MVERDRWALLRRGVVGVMIEGRQMAWNADHSESNVGSHISGRGRGWITRRIGLLVALFLGLAAVSDLSRADSTQPQIVTEIPKTFELSMDETRTFTVKLDSAPSGPVIAVFGVLGESSDKIAQYRYRDGHSDRRFWVVLNHSNWQTGAPVTIQPVGTGV